MKEKMGKTNILAKFAMAQAVATVSVVAAPKSVAIDSAKDDACNASASCRRGSAATASNVRQQQQQHCSKQHCTEACFTEEKFSFLCFSWRKKKKDVTYHGYREDADCDEEEEDIN